MWEGLTFGIASIIEAEREGKVTHNLVRVAHFQSVILNLSTKKEGLSERNGSGYGVELSNLKEGARGKLAL